MHPYINRPAKGALRWYTDPNQITRHSRACKEDSQLCPFALHWPSWQILPFQFASFDGPFLATAWGLYDMEGTLVYDLSEYIELLTMDTVTAPGPERVVVTSDAPILLDYIMAHGLYEMRITAVGGKTYYSETIHVQCGPCMVADGIYGEDTLVEGSRYLYTDGRVATYCGLECETPVDENGFNTFDACEGGIALVVSESKWGEYTWSGTEWLASFEMPCFHKLEWRDCGDVGTQLYKNNGYSNIVYLKEQDATISEPAVVWSEERDKDVNGGETVSQARKDVEWNIKTRMAWFLFDAITETPLMDEVRLRAAFALGSDLLGNIRFEYQWDGPCMIDTTMTFRLGDDSSATGCCSEHTRTPQVLPPCFGTDFPDGCQHFSFDLFGESISIGIGGGAGEYWSVVGPSGFLGALPANSADYAFSEVGAYCIYSSDEEGTPIAAGWSYVGTFNFVDAPTIRNVDFLGVSLQQDGDGVAILSPYGVEFSSAPDYAHMSNLTVLQFQYCTMPSPPIVSGNPTLTGLQVSRCSLTVAPSISDVPLLTVLELITNNLPTSEVNRMLVDGSANFTSTSGAINLSGQTPVAPPSGAGLTAKAEFEGRTPGWTVTTD